ncbi:SDR family NAD(P)-dependent oxidoreductase [Nonomuraea recticatena]|uniref:SDR family NAD(P)-dependent oxidoreductase n=1 Tax=Nonomuraea recticatena TaxID=46178 RepID=UPI00361D06B0
MTLFSVEGKTVVVTGGSRGIGRMIAAGFVAAGATVYISARKTAEVDKAAAELGCTAVPADLSTPEGVDALAEAVEGPVHVLVNNAGATWGAPLEEYPGHAFDKLWGINVKGVFHLTQRLLPACAPRPPLTIPPE